MDKQQNTNQNILKNSSFKKAPKKKDIPQGNKPEEKHSILKNKNIQKNIAVKKSQKLLSTKMQLPKILLLLLPPPIQ